MKNKLECGKRTVDASLPLSETEIAQIDAKFAPSITIVFIDYFRKGWKRQQLATCANCYLSSLKRVSDAKTAAAASQPSWLRWSADQVWGCKM